MKRIIGRPGFPKESIGLAADRLGAPAVSNRATRGRNQGLLTRGSEDKGADHPRWLPVPPQSSGGRPSVHEPQTRDGYDASWVVKYLPDALALGLIVPEERTMLAVAEDQVGIEGADIGLTHLATYGGTLAGPPGEVMRRLQYSLDFRNQPKIVVHALQTR